MRTPPNETQSGTAAVNEPVPGTRPESLQMSDLAVIVQQLARYQALQQNLNPTLSAPDHFNQSSLLGTPWKIPRDSSTPTTAISSPTTVCSTPDLSMDFPTPPPPPVANTTGGRNRRRRQRGQPASDESEGYFPLGQLPRSVGQNMGSSLVSGTYDERPTLNEKLAGDPVYIKLPTEFIEKDTILEFGLGRMQPLMTSAGIIGSKMETGLNQHVLEQLTAG